MKLLLVIFIAVVGISCGPQEKSDVEFYPVKKEHFNKYINQKEMPSNPKLSEDIHIINNDYPIEISLYKNGKWYYNLENLDDGDGTWEYKDGRIKLHAHRMLFDMHIDVEGVGEEASNLVIKFSDRFGPSTLKMEKRNTLK